MSQQDSPQISCFGSLHLRLLLLPVKLAGQRTTDNLRRFGPASRPITFPALELPQPLRLRLCAQPWGIRLPMFAGDAPPPEDAAEALEEEAAAALGEEGGEEGAVAIDGAGMAAAVFPLAPAEPAAGQPAAGQPAAVPGQSAAEQLAAAAGAQQLAAAGQQAAPGQLGAGHAPPAPAPVPLRTAVIPFVHGVSRFLEERCFCRAGTQQHVRELQRLATCAFTALLSTTQFVGAGRIAAIHAAVGCIRTAVRAACVALQQAATVQEEELVEPLMHDMLAGVAEGEMVEQLMGDMLAGVEEENVAEAAVGAQLEQQDWQPGVAQYEGRQELPPAPLPQGPDFDGRQAPAVVGPARYHGTTWRQRLVQACAFYMQSAPANLGQQRELLGQALAAIDALSRHPSWRLCGPGDSAVVRQLIRRLQLLAGMLGVPSEGLDIGGGDVIAAAEAFSEEQRQQQQQGVEW